MPELIYARLGMSRHRRFSYLNQVERLYTVWISSSEKLFLERTATWIDLFRQIYRKFSAEEILKREKIIRSAQDARLQGVRTGKCSWLKSVFLKLPAWFATCCWLNTTQGYNSVLLSQHHRVSIRKFRETGWQARGQADWWWAFVTRSKRLVTYRGSHLRSGIHRACDHTQCVKRPITFW